MAGKKLNIPCAAALGSFDGLHIGHMKVLESTLAFSEEHNLEPKIMLFDIHPREYITGEKIPKLLTDEETERILTDMGFGICRVKFAEIRSLTAEEFFEKILIEDMNAKALCCGFNYSFGINGSGSGETLKNLCAESGIYCKVVDSVSADGETVSSSAIRSHIINGEVEKAAKMLGRNYAVSGEVVHGDSRGRTLGFPTANQMIDSSLAVPKYGVYESAVTVDGKRYRAVTNIGIRPTYRTECAAAETNIIDFCGDIYGRRISVELIRYIRPEVKFDGAQELKNQLIKDIAEVTGNV